LPVALSRLGAAFRGENDDKHRNRQEHTEEEFHVGSRA